MQPASAGGSVRLAMSSVYATSKCMLDYYRIDNMARDEPQLVRAYGRKNFDPVIKEWKWPDFGNVTITLARTEGLKNFDPDAEITSWDRMKVSVPSIGRRRDYLRERRAACACGTRLTEAYRGHVRGRRVVLHE